MNNNKKKGFTLVELLVVIAILAILATVSVVGYTAFINNANKTAADQEIRQIENIINSALIVNKTVYAEIGEDTDTTTTTNVKITKGTSGITVETVTSIPTTLPTGEVDLTTDLGELAAKLSVVSGALTYTGNDTTEAITIK